MTTLEKFIFQRDRITQALNLAGITEVLYNKDNIPKNLPCAILILDSEAGKHGAAVCVSEKKANFSVIKSDDAVMGFEEIVMINANQNFPVVARYPRFEVLMIGFEAFSEGL